jgi:nickel-dependent lactate racemase
MKHMTLEIPYGSSIIRAPISAANLLGVFAPGKNGEGRDEMEILAEALARPVGAPRLRDLARPGQKAVIITSDMTRACPSDRLLPPVLDELGVAGVSDEDVTVVAALGLHRAMTPPELEYTVGTAVYERVRVINHDPARTVRLGVTSAGTPVEFFRPVVDAGLRVCLGNLEIHYFAGFSGGAKAILPGCASQATVTANHAMMVRPGAVTGRLEGNPVRADIEEAVAMLGVDFILNAVVDERRCVVGAVAGDVIAAHRQGCELVAQHFTLSIPQRADVVLAGAGGYPRDLNLYQAQKALDSAAHAVQSGGVIILVAECKEGFGNQTFETWMKDALSPDDILERIQRGFVLGGHKAAAFASVMKRARVYLVSEMPPDDVRRCGLVPFDDVSEGLRCALAEVGEGATVIALPFGGSSLPVIIQ